MVAALALILTLQLAGELASRVLGLPVPGPVIGMVALVAVLALRPAWAARVRPVSTTILAMLSLFFVPAGVGIVAHLPLLAQHGVAVGLALAVSTVLALLAGAVTFALVARWIGGADE